MQALQDLFASKIGSYVSIGIGLVAGYFGFTPDAATAPVISNLLVSIVIGAVGLIYAHFQHTAATNAAATNAAAPVATPPAVK